MWENSPNSKRIFDFYNEKFGQILAPVGLVKVLTAISPYCSEHLPNLNMFCVAPTRQVKSRTSIEAQNIVSVKYWVDLGDDITMNSILNRFPKGIGKKCLFVNDATTMFATKSKRTKDRLISGLSVLLSEGRWFYGERQNPENVLNGYVSVVMNLTTESYSQYESKLLGSTFLERFLTIFYSLNMVELERMAESKEDRMKIKFEGKIKFKKRRIINIRAYKKLLIEYAKRYSILSVKSFNGCYDQIIGLVTSNASLNGRAVITDNDVAMLRMLEPYLINTFASNQHRIIQLYIEGRTHVDICKVLGKDPMKYRPYVSRVLKKAKLRGVIT